MSNTTSHRVLPDEEVEYEIAHSRSRGDYLVQIQHFVESGDIGWDFSEVFPFKKPEAIRISINNNINKYSKKLEWPVLRIILRDDRCLVLNMTKYDEVRNNGLASEQALLGAL